MTRAHLRRATYVVGGGGRYPAFKDLPPLKPGDVVEVAPGTYNECVRWRGSGAPGQPIVLRGAAGGTRPVIDGTGLTVSGAGSVPRALFQIEGSHYVIENLEFRGARNGENGAGIRVVGATGTAVRNCRITGCEMGMMSNDNDDLLIEFCEIDRNGNPERFAGYAHNLYLHGKRTTIRFCRIHGARAGQNVKCRGHFVALLYNWIADSDEGEVGFVDSEETRAPESNAVLIGNIVISKPDRSGNTSKFLDFGQDVGKVRRGTLTLLHNTLIAGDGRIRFLNATSETRIVAAGNLFWGSRDVVSGPATGRILTGEANWLPEGAAVPSGLRGTVAGAEPGFVDARGRDFRLRPDAPARRVEVPPTARVYPDGDGRRQDGTPRFEYTERANREVEVRPRPSRPVVGAFGCWR